LDRSTWTVAGWASITSWVSGRGAATSWKETLAATEGVALGG
jgi:hypothetical protein